MEYHLYTRSLQSINSRERDTQTSDRNSRVAWKDGTEGTQETFEKIGSTGS